MTLQKFIDDRPKSSREFHCHQDRIALFDAANRDAAILLEDGQHFRLDGTSISLRGHDEGRFVLCSENREVVLSPAGDAMWLSVLSRRTLKTVWSLEDIMKALSDPKP